MYKLMVVSGPNRGTSYLIREGENFIGRQSGNGIVLQSSKVSKRHCVLVVDNDRIELQDQGSSNGTFVNGVLTKSSRQLSAGDKISVGEYVLELVPPPAAVPRSAPAIAGLGVVVQFPAQRRHAAGVPAVGGVGISGGISQDPLAATSGVAPGISGAAPTDLKGRLMHVFEARVMPFFYSLTMKNEWRMVTLSLFGLFVLANAFVSVSPLLDANRDSVVREVARRARYIARGIAEANAPALAAKAESKTDIGLAESADHVRLAVLTDLDNRIISPSAKAGQHLALGAEARFAVQAATAYRNGKESGFVRQMEDGDLIVAVEPVKVLSPALGRNIVIGMAVVSIDTTQVTLAAGDMGTIYSKTLVMSALLAALVLMIVYRLTMRPLQILNEDMDKVLKGDMPQVTHEFKFEELNSLWDLINSSLQRIPKNDQGSEGSMGSEGPSPSDYIGPLQSFASAGKLGLVVLDQDRKIVFINPAFEEISGIRGDSSVGQEISAVARDQAMGAMAGDLFERAQAGMEGPSDNFEFSGISYRVQALALGRQGEAPKCYALVASKNE